MLHRRNITWVWLLGAAVMAADGKSREEIKAGIDELIPKVRISLSMILDEKEAANRKYTKDNSNNKNNRNNGKGNRQDRKPKKEGLNLSGLAKFMH